MNVNTQNDELFPDILQVPDKSTSISYSMNSLDDFLDETSFHNRILQKDIVFNQHQQNHLHSTPSFSSQKKKSIFQRTNNISKQIYDSTPLWLKIVILSSLFMFIFALGVVVTGVQLINGTISKDTKQNEMYHSSMTNSLNGDMNPSTKIEHNNEIIAPSISPSLESLQELKEELHQLVNKHNGVVVEEEELDLTDLHTAETIDSKIKEPENDVNNDVKNDIKSEALENNSNLQLLSNTAEQKKEDNNSSAIDTVKDYSFFYLDGNNTDTSSNKNNEESTSSLSPTTPKGLKETEVGGGMIKQLNSTSSEVTPETSSGSPTAPLSPAPTLSIKVIQNPSSSPTYYTSKKDYSTYHPSLTITKKTTNSQTIAIPSGSKSNDHFVVTGGNLSENQLKTMQESNTNNTKFLVHLGNFITSNECNEQEYEKYNKILTDNMNVPTFIIPGVNDWYNCNSISTSYSYWLRYYKNFQDNWPAANNLNVLDSIGYNQHFFTFLYNKILFVGIKLIQEDESMIYYYSIKTFDYIQNLINDKYNGEITSIVILGDVGYDGEGVENGTFAFFYHFNRECGGDVTCYYMYEMDGGELSTSQVDSIISIGVPGAVLPVVKVQMD